MPRRAGGKAASRKARQRQVRRPAVPAAPPPATDDAVVVPPVGTPDAREAASLTPPPRRSVPARPNAGSDLTEREKAEYHYVERDLRNIGILTAIMAGLLLLAYLAFSAMGLVG